ncbi:BRCT domain [Macleaya cordata]|uniref:Poly [ADP-ribose] polymerase n=1 Tax=Macleaya cordata TaxID=56857 RepID=A0A200PW80_MACCD|nr:BRCT domain [Macleaya cordata]
MENTPKEWKIEYAKTSRSSCRTCKKIIKKEMLRLGKVVRATRYDGFMTTWNHTHCILKRANKIKFIDDVEGVDFLRWDDQQKMRRYIESGVFFNTTTVGVNECGIEVSQTSRAICKLCNKKIIEGEVRISTKPGGEGTSVLAWHHANCYMEWSPSTQVQKLSGWNSLSISDQEVVRALVKKSISTGKSEIKRKSGVSSDRKSKIHKAVGIVSVSKVTNENNASDLAIRIRDSSKMESNLEAQNKALWTIKDDIKKHVTIAEMREMLEVNGQHSAGSELDLIDLCADGMMFGALGSCPICSGSLRYSGVEYRCHGYVSSWSKCSDSTTEPIRLKGKWRVSEETSNRYLCKWFKSQEGQKPVRLLPALFSTQASGIQAALKDLKVAFAGFSKESRREWKSKIESAGGTVHPKVQKDTKCFIVSGKLDENNFQITRARMMGLPILGVGYLIDCTERQKMLPFDQYIIEPVVVNKAFRSRVTVKVKGKCAVHESSGLQDFCHILEDGKSIYSATLNKSDLSIGVNSYYVLQIIQEDKRPDCYLFREWGRVGNGQIGGNKLDNMSKPDAIQEFKHLFLEKTGNSWEAWEQKVNFQKQPGRFFPLDIDYGINKQMFKNHIAKSRLAPPVVKLMEMLFNVETYRSAMIELKIDMSEMPLGKLSRSNIQKGFEALTEIQNLLTSKNQDLSVRESLLIDASNRFFTIIPSIHPHVIRDENDFRSKVKVLEALQNIEIASRLVGFDVSNDESLDENYKKLRCDITPLPHDSDDYRLVEKYLLTTHASTHKDWTLELEDVFTLEREGEFDKFAPYREKLQNKMLLWHGSRLTNFVGILSQGLRIAPPEAPSTGYMFGKGIYFADLVSKSAQYCGTNSWNSVGLMLLSEVALGEVYELKNATYMEKPPEGKNSTKGLGKKMPQKSEYVTWRNEVVVPCGKPVSSNTGTSELMYNEYIVYDTAQVKMQFLLKVRFHHKS